MEGHFDHAPGATTPPRPDDSPAAALFDQPAALTHYICHWSIQRSFIYVETPKVACTTIKRVLQAAELGPDRQADTPEDVHAFGHSPLLSPASDQQGFVTAMQDENVFRFGFVRNPYARALSCWLDKMVQNAFERRRLAPLLALDPTEPPSFASFLEAVAAQDAPDRDPHWATQTYLLRPNRHRYNFLGRFETFRADFLKVCGHLSIEEYAGDLPDTWHATDATAKVRTHVGLLEGALIRRIYEDDFRNFGYGWGLEVL